MICKLNIICSTERLCIKWLKDWELEGEEAVFEERHPGFESWSPPMLA